MWHLHVNPVDTLAGDFRPPRKESIELGRLFYHKKEMVVCTAYSTEGFSIHFTACQKIRGSFAPART